MPLREANYSIAPRGRATSFTESELPPEFCLEMRNRFINSAGGAEKRQGIVQYGDTVTGQPLLTGIHELVRPDGTTVEFVSGAGAIWRLDETAWTMVHSGLDADARIRSVHMDRKLIFYNGVDRNIYTEDGETFSQLKALVEAGEATTGTDSTKLVDSTITNFTLLSDAAVNDLVYNRTNDAYGVITALASSTATHSIISNTAGATGLGVSTVGAPAPGDRYEIIDMLELNVIPTDGENDNVAIAGAATDATTVSVTAVSFVSSEVRPGDFVRNTTVGAIAMVSAVATALTVTSVAGQTAGDSLVFLKSAMPIAEYDHVHFKRLYQSDARDLRKIRISGPDNPNDQTTDAGTLDSATLGFGSFQPQGDAVVSMSSYQRFFIIAGKKNTYAFEGTNPIVDTSADTSDFEIVGLFPQGVVSPDALESIGNDMAIVTTDGLQSISMIADASTLGRANLSEAIKTTLRDAIANTDEDDIQLIHYPRRSWLILKVGTELHIFNYTAFFGEDQTNRFGILTPQRGSWSLFDGKFALQKAYFVRRDGTLMCCGAGGKVYLFDQGTFDDDGEAYKTEYQTGWLTLDEPERRVTIRQIHYIKPIVNLGGNITYSVMAEGNFAADASDEISITATSNSNPIGLWTVGTDTVGGAGFKNQKYSLRVRGEQIRLTFTTEDALGPDTLSRFTVYATVWGRK